MKNNTLSISEKSLLTLEEATEYFNIGVKKRCEKYGNYAHRLRQQNLPIFGPGGFCFSNLLRWKTEVYFSEFIMIFSRP